MTLRNSSRYWWLVWTAVGLISIGTVAFLHWFGPRRFSADVFAAAETISTDPKMVGPVAHGLVAALIETLTKERGSPVRVEFRLLPSKETVHVLRVPYYDPNAPHIYGSGVRLKLTPEGKTPDEALAAAQQASNDAKVIYSRLLRKQFHALRNAVLAIPPMEEKARHHLVSEMERFEHSFQSSEFSGAPFIHVQHAIHWKPYLPDSFFSNFSLATFIAVLAAFCSHRISSRLLALRSL